MIGLWICFEERINRMCLSFECWDMRERVESRMIPRLWPEQLEEAGATF